MAWACVKRCQMDFYLPCWRSVTKVESHVPRCVGIRQVYLEGLARMEISEGSLKPCWQTSPIAPPGACQKRRALSSIPGLLDQSLRFRKTAEIRRHTKACEVLHVSTVRRLHGSADFSSVTVNHLPDLSHEWRCPLNISKEEKGYYSIALLGKRAWFSPTCTSLTPQGRVTSKAFLNYTMEALLSFLFPIVLKW